MNIIRFPVELTKKSDYQLDWLALSEDEQEFVADIIMGIMNSPDGLLGDYYEHVPSK